MATLSDDSTELFRRWLTGMHELLNESPAYQEMTRMAHEVGYKVGLEQGLLQGQLQVLRQMVTDIVSERFPDLVRLAEGKTADVSEPFLLRRVALKLSTVTTVEEARQALLKLSEEY